MAIASAADWLSGKSGSGGGGALEELRREKAKIAKLDRLEREGTRVDIAELKAKLALGAACMRRAHEQVRRRFGVEVVEILERGVKEFEQKLNGI